MKESYVFYMNVLKMQNVAIRNSHLLRDKICKHISQNYNLIIVHIQSAHDSNCGFLEDSLQYD